MANGLSTGSYTSPHLQRVNERMAWNGEPVDDLTLDELLLAVAAVEDLLPDAPSYFEILTAAALRWFGDIAVDAAVVEVGLGRRGRRHQRRRRAGGGGDERVARPRGVHRALAWRDRHREGRNREAGQHSGAGRDRSGAGRAIPRLAIPSGSCVAITTSVSPRTGSRWADGCIDLFTPYGKYADVFLALHGAHQADNAAIALAAVECFLERALEPDLVADAFASVRTPGRLEVVGRQPLVLLDGVKNVAGARALRAALAEEFADVAAHASSLA